MKRLLLIFIFSLSSLFLFADDEITFSGGRSTLNLTEGEEEVVLSEGATVSVDTLVIESDEITLSGSAWRYVVCSGYTVVSDEERGIEIRTRRLSYDREKERLLISSWFEIDDTKQELSAMGGTLLYDMKDEILELNKNVSLLKVTNDGVMECSAESVVFERDNNMLYLRGASKVVWGDDSYEAEAITVNTETDDITLDGRIQGAIYG